MPMRTAASLLLPFALSFAQSLEQPVRSVTDPGVITTRQAITPAGVSSVFQGRTYGLAWAGDGDDLWVLHASQIYRFDWKNNRVVSRVPNGGAPGNQSIASAADGSPFFGVSVREGGRTKAQIRTVQDGAIKSVTSDLGRFQPGALAVADKVVAVPLVYENKLAIVSRTDGSLLKQVDTGIAPFAAALNKDASVAYVTNLGGRPPKPGELVASPMQKPDEKIVVDQRGVASTGTVMRIDTKTGEVTHKIAVGLHPTGIVLDESHKRLYIANGNSESVSVIDTDRNAVVRTIEIQPFSDKVRGVAPTSLQVSADGSTLYVACGGINAVAVIDTKTGQLTGLIPTGWYPNAISLDRSGKHLAVSSLLGAGSAWQNAPARRYVHAYRGSVAVVTLPDREQLASYTTAVAENNRLRLKGSVESRSQTASAKPVAIPARSGEPSLIEHVIFIIKENRTYDQVLGDIPKGNGDPSLVMFGKDITPNQHQIAEQFVLLDNFYATGGNSGDGHQWLTQANETEYCLWPGYQGRSYPFDGSDPMAYSSGGFLWDYALARGRSVKIYGEYAGRFEQPPATARIELLKEWEAGADFTKRWTTKAPIEPVNKILAAHYPAYTNAIPDLARAQIFLNDLKKYEESGKLPNLIFLQLPSDHTYGTSPGITTPRAMVAENDFALGQIIEGLSHSKFWPKMAIFVVEDDAQNGVDHVDGHRTIAFVASPYTKRGAIDSTFYAHQSILKTIELILGLPTMSIFDLIATDMRASFTNEPNLTPFTAVRPKQDLFEVNPPAKSLTGEARAGALASAKMNWSAPDAVPAEKLNRILWGSIRGWKTPYPQRRVGTFSPLGLDVDDDDR